MSHDARDESITRHEVGLRPDEEAPFRFRPGERWTPIVMSFPHVGLSWPLELATPPAVDYARNSDYMVQSLFEGVQAWGVATVEAVYSRLVVDLNRAHDDVSRELVPDHPAPRPRRRPGVPAGAAGGADHGHQWDRPGRGVVWASAVGLGSPVRVLAQPLEFAAFDQRIRRYHLPYYRAVELLLDRRRQRFGYAILIDGHSMPGSVGVDLVVGTLDGVTCAPTLRQFALRQLAPGPGALGPLLSVRVDDPYRGGEIIRRFGRPLEGVHAFQLEVSRRLYMDEHRQVLLPPGDPASALGEVLDRVRRLVARLAEHSDTLGLEPAAMLGSAAAE